MKLICSQCSFLTPEWPRSSRPQDQREGQLQCQGHSDERSQGHKLQAEAEVIIFKAKAKQCDLEAKATWLPPLPVSSGFADAGVQVHYYVAVQFIYG